MAGSGLAVTNLIQLGYIPEVTPGTTPVSQMQNLRAKTQSLNGNLTYVTSQEYRSDRQVPDQILVDANPGGSVGLEASFGTFDTFIAAALQGAWSQAAYSPNGQVTSTSVYALNTGVAGTFAVGHLVQGSGFSTAANNGTNVVTAGGTTTVTVSGTPLTIEAAPTTGLNTATVVAAGTGYVPTNTITLTGGTFSTAGILTVAQTNLVSLTSSGGTLYTVGDTIVLSPTGGTQVSPVTVRVATSTAGAATTVAVVAGSAGAFTANPTGFTQLSSSGTGTGAAFSVPVFGVNTVTVTTAGVYSVLAGSYTQGSTSGSGTGATFTATANNFPQKIVRAVGFQAAASGDITATATGLASTTTNFTTFGLQVGQWIKVGGAAVINQFATAVNNDYAKITAITPTALTLTYLPTGWSVDAGTGKLIRVIFGDFVRNGVIQNSFTVERYHADVARYFTFRGMYIDKMSLNVSTQSLLDGSFDFKGLTMTEGAVTSGTGAALAAPTNDVMNATSNVPRVYEGGTIQAAKTKSLGFQLMNNMRDQNAVGVLGNVGIGDGQFNATISLSAYYINGSLYAKYLAGTQTDYAFIVKDLAGNAYVVTYPAVRLTACTVDAGNINQDVMLSATASAKIDPVTNCMVQIDRIFTNAG